MEVENKFDQIRLQHLGFSSRILLLLRPDPDPDPDHDHDLLKIAICDLVLELVLFGSIITKILLKFV